MKKLLGIVVLGLLFCNSSFSFEKFKALPKINLYLGVDVDSFVGSMRDYSYFLCDVSYWNNETLPSYANLDFSYPDPFINFAKKYKGKISVNCSKNKYIFTNIKNEPQENEFFLSFVACRGKIFEYSISSHFANRDFGSDIEIFEIWANTFKEFSNRSPEIKKYESDFKSQDGKISRQVNHEVRYNDEKKDILFYLSKRHYYFKKYGPDGGGTHTSMSLINNSIKKHKACW